MVESKNESSPLRQVQRQFASVVMRPLNRDWEVETVWTDGRATAQVVAEFIKPNDRMTSLERIALYNKQYWFRLIDIMYEDYPGLAAVLGDKQFVPFCEAYLTAHPSKSGLLRNLGKHLAAFIPANSEFTSPHTQMAGDVARLEWAQVEAFDRASQPALRPQDMQGRDPVVTTLKLQPFVSLVDGAFAVDKLVTAVKKQSLRSETSNTADTMTHGRRRRKLAKPEKVNFVVHRADNLVYVKRVTPEAYAILKALDEGVTIAQAVEHAVTHSTDDTIDWSGQIQQWFASWMNFGWFSRR